MATHNDHPPSLEFFAKEDRTLALTHVIQVQNNDHWFEAFVDAHSGEIVNIIDFVAHASVCIFGVVTYDRGLKSFIFSLSTRSFLSKSSLSSMEDSRPLLILQTLFPRPSDGIQMEHPPSIPPPQLVTTQSLSKALKPPSRNKPALGSTLFSTSMLQLHPRQPLMLMWREPMHSMLSIPFMSVSLVPPNILSS